MPRLLALAMLVVVAAFSGRLAHAAAGGASDPSIVVGIVATLSGPNALAGQDVVDGFQLALRQMGGRFANQEVRVVITDDLDRPDHAMAQIGRLIERERLDIVLTGIGASSLAAIMPTLTNARLFVLNLNIASTSLAGADCSPFLFDLAAPADGTHEAMGQYLAGEQVRRLVVVGPDMPQTGLAVAALKRTFPGEVVASLPLRQGAATYDAEIRQIRAQKPDAVYSLLTGGMGVGFVRAFHAAGLKAELPLFTVWNAVERPTLAAMGEAALDVISIGTWTPDMESNRRLIQDFETEHGRSATTWAAQGYDAALLIDSALKSTQGRTVNAEAVRAGLRRADFVSVRGGFRFNTNHTPILSYHVRKVVRDQRGRLTNELRSTVLKDWRDRNAAACPMRWEEAIVPAAPTAPRR